MTKAAVQHARELSTKEVKVKALEEELAILKAQLVLATASIPKAINEAQISLAMWNVM